MLQKYPATKPALSVISLGTASLANRCEQGSPEKKLPSL